VAEKEQKEKAMDGAIKSKNPHSLARQRDGQGGTPGEKTSDTNITSQEAHYRTTGHNGVSIPTAGGRFDR